MRVIILSSLVLSLAASDFNWFETNGSNSIEAYGFGTSIHSNKHISYNNKNWGGGLGFVHKIDRNPGETDIDFTLVGGSYIDSYGESARFLMPGFRVNFGDRNAFHSSLGLNVGYFEGSGYPGVGVMPIASMGYSMVDLCVTGNPLSFISPSNNNGSSDPKQNRNASGGFLGFFVKVKLCSW
jgi:hypothetical protein